MTARAAEWKALLQDCRDWFDRALDPSLEADGETAGDGFLNGDGRKYRGNGWREAEKLRRRLTRALDRKDHR